MTNTSTFNAEKFSNLKEWREDKYTLKKIYRLINTYISKGTGKKLLDVGCADGSFATMLIEDFGFEVYGVDISTKSIETANKNGINAIVTNLDNKLPYDSNCFDVIIMSEVIEHIFDTNYLLSELRRVMKKGAYLFITTPNVASFTSRLKILFGGYPNGLEYCVNDNTNGHIRAYTPKILKKQLRFNNFEIVKMTSPNFLFPMKMSSIPASLKEMMIGLSDLTKNLGEEIVAVVRK